MNTRSGFRFPILVAILIIGMIVQGFCQLFDLLPSLFYKLFSTSGR